jgi:hypothetical protein
VKQTLQQIEGEEVGAAAVATTMANKAVEARVNFIGQTKVKGKWFCSITKSKSPFYTFMSKFATLSLRHPLLTDPSMFILLNSCNKHNYVLLNIPPTYVKRQKRVGRRGFRPPTQPAS